MRLILLTSETSKDDSSQVGDFPFGFEVKSIQFKINYLKQYVGTNSVKRWVSIWIRTYETQHLYILAVLAFKFHIFHPNSHLMPLFLVWGQSFEMAKSIMQGELRAIFYASLKIYNNVASS